MPVLPTLRSILAIERLDRPHAMKKLPNALVLFLLFFLSGCLEIDGQDVALRYDEENDRIDALFVHRGIYAEGGTSGGDPIEAATKDLEEAMETGRFIFWNNWPLTCNPSKDYDAARNTLLQHVEVENGHLFTDPQGILCGYQFVRVNKAKTFLKKLNTMIELGLQAACVTGVPGLGDHKLDEDSQENLREFLRSREPFLTIEKGRIELRLPLSKRDHKWFKQIIEDHFMDNMPREIARREVVAKRRADGHSVTDTTSADETVSIEGTALRQEIERAPSYRFFWDNEITFQRTQELTTIGIGTADDDELRIKKSPDGMYHDAFMQKLRDDKFQIEDGLPDQELTRRFEDFLTRDAKLPKQLQAKRG
jgi:hypothetical protein